MAKDPILEALEQDKRTLVVRLSRRAIREIDGKPPGAYWIGDAMVVVSEDDPKEVNYD